MSQTEYDRPTRFERKYTEEIGRMKHLLRQVRSAPHNRKYRLVDRADFTHTRTDMEWIINRLGYRPTRTMWEEVGVTDIERTYVGRGPDWLDHR
jgi:hypothetical protein